MIKIISFEKVFLFAIIFLLVSLNAHAHDGKLDSNGCHSNGEIAGYHCHDRKSVTEKPKKEKGHQYYFVVSGGILLPNGASIGSNDPDTREVFNQGDFSTSTNPRFSVVIAPGIKFNGTNFRAELEYSYKQIGLEEAKPALDNKWLDGRIMAHSFMANIFYDFNNKSYWTPYLGIGVGWALLEHSVNEFEIIKDEENKSIKTEKGFLPTETTGKLAYQAMVGVQASISKASIINLGYRYFSTSDVEWDMLTAKVGTHVVEIGWRYMF